MAPEMDRSCAVCSEPISVARPGRVCDGCGNPVHHTCSDVAAAVRGDAQKCQRCGLALLKGPASEWAEPEIGPEGCLAAILGAIIAHPLAVILAAGYVALFEVDPTYTGIDMGFFLYLSYCYRSFGVVPLMLSVVGAICAVGVSQLRRRKQ
jgi:hypothetical protein